MGRFGYHNRPFFSEIGIFQEAVMVALETPVCDFGQPAPDFSLPGVAPRVTGHTQGQVLHSSISQATLGACNESPSGSGA